MADLPHPEPRDLDLAAVLQALADPTRLAIVRRLAAGGECACGDIAVGVSPGTASHHFRVLREAGVIRVRAEGKRRFMSLRDDAVPVRFPGLLEAIAAEAQATAQASAPA